MQRPPTPTVDDSVGSDATDSSSVSGLPTDGISALEARTPWRQHTARILFIDDRVPHEWLGYGYPRARRFLAELAKDPRRLVTLYPLPTPTDDSGDPFLDSVEIIANRGEAELSKFLSERRGIYDLVIVSRPANMSSFLAAIAAFPEYIAGAHIVYDAEAIAATRSAHRARVNGTPLPITELHRMRAAELQLGNRADTVLCVSSAEAQQFAAHGHPDVRVLGHALTPTPTPTAFEDRTGFLFVGAMPDDECPNADAIVWFIDNVWPVVVSALDGDVTLDVVGRCTSPDVRRRGGGRVHIHGAVPDLAPYYASARVHVVPTRFAAGIPMKAHQAAANGLPMVTSTLIRDQLGWTGELAAARTAEEFAAACVRLYSDREEWERQRAAALEAVTVDCDEQRFADTVTDLVSAVERIPRSTRHSAS